MSTGTLNAHVVEGRLKVGGVFTHTARTRLQAYGVQCFALSDDSIRFVTHSDLSTDDIEHAIGQICTCFANDKVV
jgi:threonine aldolase